MGLFRYFAKCDIKDNLYFDVHGNMYYSIFIDMYILVALLTSSLVSVLTAARHCVTVLDHFNKDYLSYILAYAIDYFLTDFV